MERLDDDLDALFATARRETPPALPSVAADVTRRLRLTRLSAYAETGRWPSLRLLAGMGVAAAMVALIAIWAAQSQTAGWEEQVFSEPTAGDEIAWAYAL